MRYDPIGIQLSRKIRTIVFDLSPDVENEITTPSPPCSNEHSSTETVSVSTWYTVLIAVSHVWSLISACVILAHVRAFGRLYLGFITDTIVYLIPRMRDDIEMRVTYSLILGGQETSNVSHSLIGDERPVSLAGRVDSANIRSQPFGSSASADRSFEQLELQPLTEVIVVR